MPWPIHLHRYGGYEDALFAQQVVRTVVEHDPTAPYFLFCKHCQPTNHDRISSHHGLKPDVSQLNRWRLVGCVAGAPHIVHAPLQVPPEFYHRFDFMAETDNAFQSRQTYRQPPCPPLTLPLLAVLLRKAPLFPSAPAATCVSLPESVSRSALAREQTRWLTLRMRRLATSPRR